MISAIYLHNITGIAIGRKIYENEEETDRTVINITITDMSGAKTEISCFVESEYTMEPFLHHDIATRYIAA